MSFAKLKAGKMGPFKFAASAVLAIIRLIVVLLSPGVSGQDRARKLALDVFGFGLSFGGLGLMFVFRESEPEKTIGGFAKVTRAIEWIAGFVSVATDLASIADRLVKGEYETC